ncbi:MAG: ornithine cyclodeaminase family protein [Pseudomonadota bacterium]
MRNATTRLLTRADLSTLISAHGADTLMGDMIAAIETAFVSFDEAKCTVPVRSGFSYTAPRPGLVEWMPILRQSDHVTLKMVGYHPENPGWANLPTIQSMVGRWDTDTGRLVAICEGGLLTALRTGAASSVASKALAKADASTLGLIGAGAQAVTQLHALSQVFDLSCVLIHDSQPAHAASFPSRVAGRLKAGVRIETSSTQRMLAEADIICTATTVAPGDGPLFSSAADAKAHLHVNAIGADFPGKTELPLDLMQSAFVVPDFTEQAIREGECQQLRRDEIGMDLTALLQRPGLQAQLHSARTVFDSTGFALEDDAALSLILDLAGHYDIGSEIEMETPGLDVLNPYDAAEPTASSTSPLKLDTLP